MRIKQLLLTLFLALICFLVKAQETTSEIRGVITDSKSPLNGVTISALHTPTGTLYTTISRKDGKYNLANMKVGGPYTLTITSVGFITDKQENIYLTLGQEYNASVTLKNEIKSSDVVTVIGNKQDKVFNNSRTGSQELINRTQIERLPTINRSLADFTKLTPSSNGLSFGGVSAQYNNLTVDGANFNNAFGLSGTLGGQTNSQPISIDAIEQIQVNLSPFDVRQGSFTGAGVNSVTRSGTNNFKGSIYNFSRNENTQGYKVNNAVAVKTPIQYGQIGASIGGPIIKNKLFFFISYEQEKIALPGSPTWRAAKAGESSDGVSISQANVDTLARLKNFLVSKFGYNPGEVDGYNYRTESKKATIRFDYNLNAKNILTVKYNFLKSLRDLAASNSGAAGSRQPSVTGMPFSGNGYTINNNFNILIAELNTKINAKMNNKIQVGYTALRDFRESLSGGNFPLVDILNGFGATYTSFGYEPFTYNNKLNSNIFQLSDIFTMYKGSHELTFGTNIYKKDFVNGFAPNYNGYFRFNTLADFYIAANNPYVSNTNPGIPTASVQRLQYATTKDGSFPFAEIGATEIGVFVQDKFRVKNNFVITGGLRIDATNFKNKFATNDSLKALIFRDGIKVDVGAKPEAALLISPRLGFNWDVLNDKTLQIRGGIGIFSGPPPFVWVSNQAGNNGVQFGSFQRGPGISAGQPLQPFSADVNAYRPPAGLLSTSYNIAVTDKNFKYPQNLKTSLAIDKKLKNNWTITLEGNYTKDINAVYFQNINLPSTGVALVGSDNRIRYSATQIYAGSTLSNPNISDVILMKNSSKGYGYFATVQIQKSAKNFNGCIAYTYSKAQTLNDGGSIAQSNWRDRPIAGDPNANDLGYANFYQPHRVIAYASYRKEYAKYFATSIGLTYEAAPNGSASYTYNGDVNNDGSGGNNDLMYIPKDANDILLLKSSTADPRTAAQMWAQLDNFIKQDPYLESRRGKYAERNGALAPFFKKVNLNVTQDFFYFTKDKTKHTVRLTFDIFNVGNLLNKQWGFTKTLTTTNPLRFVGINADGKPAFTFPYLDNNNQIPVVNRYRDNLGIDSRWQMQIGVRYLFN
jgi:hypothetical protein